ncbi:hypothetical protein [Changpingibacter yushuensis]|uniref:hypothetical protein n=1 Tax=Changpingibacter yushuensis TaxID=2758440 RepID=UPI0015F6F5AA|nr:hypothetical protein [Changpingibacter yushuensis]
MSGSRREGTAADEWKNCSRPVVLQWRINPFRTAETESGSSGKVIGIWTARKRYGVLLGLTVPTNHARY